MTRYAVTRLDEIDEVSDGRCPYRPVRHHFGISSFAVNAWTARAAGDRVINEHDESEPDSDEEPFGWEIWAPLGPLYEAGDYAEAAVRGRSERFRSYAEEESDFDPIRDEPGFKELLRR